MGLESPFPPPPPTGPEFWLAPKALKKNLCPQWTCAEGAGAIFLYAERGMKKFPQSLKGGKGGGLRVRVVAAGFIEAHIQTQCSITCDKILKTGNKVQIGGK